MKKYTFLVGIVLVTGLPLWGRYIDQLPEIQRRQEMGARVTASLRVRQEMEEALLAQHRMLAQHHMQPRAIDPFLARLQGNMRPSLRRNAQQNARQMGGVFHHLETNLRTTIPNPSQAGRGANRRLFE